MNDSEQLGPVAIVGTTTWGTTLARMLARRGLEVRLLARSDSEATQLNADRQHSVRLPGYLFPDSMRVLSDWGEGLHDAVTVVFAVPSSTVRENARRAMPSVERDSIVVSACKGLETGSFKSMSTVLAEEMPGNASQQCVLSGPNLAREIVRDLPTSTVIASKSVEAAGAVQGLLNSATFRVYTNSDVIGTELGGALKNVIAIGAGICDGMGLGDNAKASFLTRGLAEITRLGVAAGAHSSTFAGSAGLGDLLTTCYSDLSRNRRVGLALGRGRGLEQALQSLGGEVAEGVTTTPAALEMARELGIEMPITEMTRRVLFEDASAAEAVQELMARAPRAE